jgi:hypothetical protein
MCSPLRHLQDVTPTAFELAGSPSLRLALTPHAREFGESHVTLCWRTPTSFRALDVSIRAEVVDGRFVVSPPATSGCIQH